MRTDQKIDFVSPPFPGHLFPSLQLAKYAKSQGYELVRFFSSPKMQATIERAGVEFRPVLADKEAEVLDIVLGTEHTMKSVKAMLDVVNRTLDLQRQFSDELRNYWQTERPDLIVVDHISPFAGIVAEELGIPWWTAINCPTHLEFKKGTPACLGGWMPPKTVFGKCRDTVGRSVVRIFKKFVFRLFRRKIQALGFKSVYREDGSERLYSNDVMLGIGIPEFDFNTDWPKAMHWIGPFPGDPSFLPPAPAYESGKKHVLVSLGMQIPWAKERAKNVIREVAKLLPNTVFHFTLGSDLKEPLIEDNLRFYGYLPYTPESFQNYDVIVNHGGTGVLYMTMMAGVPQLIWPQDFDQHDNAARVAFHGFGLRSRGKPKSIATEIETLFTGDSYRKRAEEFRQIVDRYQPGQAFVELLRKKFA